MEETKINNEILIAQVLNILGEINFKEKKYNVSLSHHANAKKRLSKLDEDNVQKIIEMAIS